MKKLILQKRSIKYLYKTIF